MKGMLDDPQAVRAVEELLAVGNDVMSSARPISYHLVNA